MKNFQKIIGNNQNPIIFLNLKNWNKKYSTQEAELNLFCGDNDNFLNLKEKFRKFYQ